MKNIVFVYNLCGCRCVWRHVLKYEFGPSCSRFGTCQFSIRVLPGSPASSALLGALHSPTTGDQGIFAGAEDDRLS